MKWTDGLKHWRADRNILAPQGNYFGMIAEELDEYTLAKDSHNEHAMIDALADIMVLTANEVALMGYELDLVMKQVVKHISSREQDPAQRREWNTVGPSGKWQKNPNQDPATLIEPDYSVCRTRR